MLLPWPCEIVMKYLIAPMWCASFLDNDKVSRTRRVSALLLVNCVCWCSGTCLSNQSGAVRTSWRTRRHDGVLLARRCLLFLEMDENRPLGVFRLQRFRNQPSHSREADKLLPWLPLLYLCHRRFGWSFLSKPRCGFMPSRCCFPPCCGMTTQRLCG